MLKVGVTLDKNLGCLASGGGATQLYVRWLAGLGLAYGAMSENRGSLVEEN